MKKARVLRITQLGEPVLRRVAKAVKVPLSAKHERLIDDMIATMKKAQGVGIAANQVGEGLRIFIVAPEPSVRYPKAPRSASPTQLSAVQGRQTQESMRLPPIAMINPVLVKKSAKKVTDWEGCLSIPGIRARVPRHQSIEIEFTLRDGRRVRGKLSGFVARIFQHEFDHINGHVYLDRVEDTRTFMTEVEYRKMMSA